VSVAVASNFADPVRLIAQQFEAKTRHRVVLSFGSTGKHYAQITNGAPFDVFLAADDERPKRLEQDSLAVAGSRFTYAVGRLVLWSQKVNYIDSTGSRLAAGDFRHLAIANPRLAPYGRAAVESLEALGLWKQLRELIVRGENINQTFQFVKSGNAELGFVACSQVIHPDRSPGGSFWIVPQELYAPIEQQAVLLKDNPSARGFLEYLRSEPAREIIRTYGYDVE
jgi:molybdate transport system substrate-binding protein